MLKIEVSQVPLLAKDLSLDHQPTADAILILVFTKQITSVPLTYSEYQEFANLQMPKIYCM